MRKLAMLGAISLAATVAAAAADLQQLDVKTGLWQVTFTTAIQGMGTPHVVKYQSCVTKDNLNQYPFADRENNCQYKVQSSTARHMDVSGTCLPSEGGKADFKIRLDVVDAEDVTGTGQLTLGDMHGDYSGKGKWVSPSCPAGVQ